jgi:hypothetical protein
MTVKELWTDDDFDDMNWHDCSIHSISFPSYSQRLIFDIDYLFEWKVDAKKELYNFLASPCTLIFLNTSDLIVNFDFGDTVGLSIESISRKNARQSINKLATMWDYLIQTDKGLLKFIATGYAQKVRNQPIWSKSQILQREQA